MKKGFTLIELLAVIIVLAIIALIATPSIINVINSAKDKSDLESVHGILDSARLFYSESMLNSDLRGDIENLNNIYEKVSLSIKEKTGELYINEKGLSAIAIVIRNKCYTKQFTGDIKITENIDNCTLGYVGIDTTAPTVTFNVEDGVFNSNGWSKNNFNVNITISDSESGPNSYKYCIDTKNCEPTTLVNNNIGFSEISNNSETNKVCVIGIDNYGNESDTICSDDYKLDSVMPTLTATADNIEIKLGESNLVGSYFTEPTYGISGGTLSCNPENTSELSIGNQTITCTATSNSGLLTIVTKNISIVKLTTNLTYGGSGSDVSNSIVQTSDGGYIITGYTSSSDGDITDGNNGNSDILVMKFSSVGTKVWNKTYGGSGPDVGTSIIQTSDGGYIITGNTISSDGDITDGNNGGNDVLVMKLNSDGTKVWDKTYGGSGFDVSNSIIQTSDGGYVITGYTTSGDGDITDGNNGVYDVLVMKLNSNGSKAWDKTYGGTGADYGFSIIQSSDGGYIITGYTTSSDGDITDGNNGGNDVLVMKLNSNGSKAWDKTYGGSNADDGFSIIQSSDGGYILTGVTSSNDGDITDGNNGGNDVLVMKLNSNGSKAWDKTYGGSGSDLGYSIIKTSDNNYVLIGNSQSNDGDITDGNKGSNDVLVIKLNSSGIKKFIKTYGGSGNDASNSIVQTSEGYILTGLTSSNDGDITDGNKGSNDVLLTIFDNNFNF